MRVDFPAYAALRDARIVSLNRLRDQIRSTKKVNKKTDKCINKIKSKRRRSERPL